jgi:hypothetical protein
MRSITIRQAPNTKQCCSIHLARRFTAKNLFIISLEAFGSGKTSPVSSFQTIKRGWREVEDKEKRTFKGEKILAIQQKQRSSKTNHARLYGFHV